MGQTRIKQRCKMNKILKWFENLFENIEQGQEYEQVSKELKECQMGHNHLQRKCETLEEDIESLEEEIKVLLEDLESTEEQLEKKDKHSSLQAYKKWMDTNVSEKQRYYNFGKGRRRVHHAFKESVQYKDAVFEFLSKDMKFDGSMYDSADELVYEFNKHLSRQYPTRSYYAYDRELYGKIEYWANIKETIAKLRDGGKAYDCDDSMILRYSCLYHLLKKYFPGDVWRLRGFIVDLWTGGGHAMLGWVKSGVNSWVPIETTYFDDKQGKLWRGDYTIHNQVLYDIRYSFDHTTEYEKID